MRLEAFDYALPAERIAQHPARERDGSRLLVLDRKPGVPIENASFHDLPGFLHPGDLLVLNDTRVLPARLIGKKASGGRIEILLVEPDPREPASIHEPSSSALGAGAQVWLCLAGFSRSPAPGSALTFSADLAAEYLGPAGGEMHRVLLQPAPGLSLREALARTGRVPLPPYIARNGPAQGGGEDAERYQTVYARQEGAIAAPTAGLHFTDELLRTLAGQGIGSTRLTLHVGPATFVPVRTEEVEDHPMPSERYEVPRAAAEAVARTREAGGRIVAVGTTVVRALESACDGGRGVLCARGRSDLFIYPGFRFRVVDALITNFHLPRSTLLMLVCAFAGRERVLGAYHAALEEGYRFYSYGDAMLIL